MKEIYVKSTDIAALFGVSIRRVQQLTQDGLISTTKYKDANNKTRTGYEMYSTVSTYIKYLSDKANGREKKENNTNATTRKLEAEADWKRAKADIAEMELNELLGKMHRSEDVENVITDLVYAIRSAMLALPGRCAVDTANAQTASETSAIIKREVDAALTELEDYRYDPEVFAQRVRDRQGWQGASEEDDNGTE